MQRIHITPAFGHRTVDSITRQDVERLARGMLARGLAPKTVRNVTTFLSSMFSLAVDNGWVTANPVAQAARSKRRRHRDSNPDIQFLTIDELEALYVGGDFQDGGGVLTADYLLACDVASGVPSDTITDPAHPFSGPVKALTATSDWTLYAGGRFGNLENIPEADNVAFVKGGGWHPMGAGGGPCTCALDAYVRGLSSNGTDVYVGTEGSNVASIAQADHVAKWDGSAWSALGSNAGGTDGWFPAGTNIHDLVSVGPNVFATGTFQNASGELLADNIAWFDGTKWQPVGSDGAGNGPWVGEGSALAIVDQQLYAAGNFTSAGGDSLAGSAASFALSQVIAQPTPTVTPGPSAVPTPTVTPGPATAGSDIAAPRTSLRRTQINQARRMATFRFASSEQGSTFVCKLDRKSFSPAPRRRLTASSGPASTCSVSRPATVPATSMPPRRSRGSESRGGDRNDLGAISAPPRLACAPPILSSARTFE